jgi:hypothetical protein
MHIPSSGFIVGGLLFTLAACSGSSGGTSGGSPGDGGSGEGGGTSAMHACTDSAHASCTKRDTCSLGGYVNDSTYGSESACESRTVPTCLDGLGAKGTGQTPAKIEDCVAAYASSYACADYFDNNPPTACVPPAGTLATGAACGASAQCASTYCATGQYAVCGTCQPLPAAGAPCQGNADCGRDLACVKPAGSTTLTMGTCAAWVASGGACLTNTAPCEANLACVGDDVTTKKMGTCQAQPTTVGAACDGSRKTAPNCNGDLGLVCIPTAKTSSVGTCKTISLVAGGMPCGDIGTAPITGYAACQAGGLCAKAAPTDFTGTCVAAAKDGAACDGDPSKGPPCQPPAKCVPTAAGATTGTCTVPNAEKCM